MVEIKVKASKSYSIYVDKGNLKNLGSILKDNKKPCKVAIITDSNVEKIYLSTVMDDIKNSGYDVYSYVIEAGEQSKNLESYCNIMNFLAENSFTRTDLCIALGGGVVGDLTGFVASCYMRGIDFVQVPTTILSQIDSSVGGKTAVDLPSGKNLVGTFYQPLFVLCDIDTTSTLTQDVFNDGMGEMSKNCCLIGEEFCQLVEENNLSKNLMTLIVKSIEYKRDVVERDEFEHGERKLLNLGHTIAHGIEKLSNYTITHGKAVGMGMRVIAKSSMQNHMISEELYKRIMNVVELCGQVTDSPYSMEELVETFSHDKKCDGGDITLIMIEGLGNCTMNKMKLSKALEILK